MADEQPRKILVEIRDFFGMSAGEFTREWKTLTAQDKTDLKSGITDGSLTY